MARGDNYQPSGLNPARGAGSRSAGAPPNTPVTPVTKKGGDHTAEDDGSKKVAKRELPEAIAKLLGLMTVENTVSFAVALMLVPFVQGAFYGLGEVVANVYLGTRMGWSKYGRGGARSASSSAGVGGAAAGAQKDAVAAVTNWANAAAAKSKDAAVEIGAFAQDKIGALVASIFPSAPKA